MDEIAEAVKIEASHRRDSTVRFRKRKQQEGWPRDFAGCFSMQPADEPREAWTNLEPYQVIAILER